MPGGRDGMRARKKLTAGLLVAGTFSAGFGAAVMPAAAEPRTLLVTLVGGKQITVQVDVPAGTPLDQIPIPGVNVGIVAIQEVGQPAPAPVLPGLPGGATPSQPAQPQAPAAGGDAPQAERQKAQKTSGKRKRRARTDAGGFVGGVGEQGAPARRPSREKSAIRDQQGAPTPANPGYSMALPGPAPIGVPNFFIEKFRIPPFLLPIYQAAGIEYGIRWEVLAAINEIETDYGRNLNVSSAGAVGWMQFLPSTWKQYGVDANKDRKKDPYNPVDAIFAAARYLKAAGAEQDLKKAIFAYNHADWYVDSVLLRARLIGGMPAGLVGSLSGLTQGHFPVHAKATYADDLSEADTTRKIAKGRNAAIPV
ncbi:MAG TPA: lytic transglycosylase domain-containing protein, partial [Baekduia sp.]|nr:lytic transglycosylase domain-containing protein [Baekduia sp.]